MKKMLGIRQDAHRVCSSPRPGLGVGSWLFFAFLAVYSLAVLVSIGPIMRESDQAGILHGIVEVAREGRWFALEWYNAARQFGTYWFLGAVFRLVGLHELGLSPEAVVHGGNLAAALVFLIGIWFLALRKRPRNWAEVVVWCVSLLAPTVLFSAPFLSSNILSAGVLCLLAGILESRRAHWWFYGLLASLSFAATSLRADAVLIMPWFAVLVVREWSWAGFLRDVRLWALAIGGGLALGVGELVAIYPGDSYLKFFAPETFVGFLVFGASGALVLLAVLLVKITLGWRRHMWWSLLAMGSALAPLLMYGRVLYSPRHLFLTVLIVLLSAVITRSRLWWEEVSGTAWGQICLGFLSAAVVGQVFFGIGMNSMRSGRVVAFSKPTFFPTADGYWPMGCNAWFLACLRTANTRPIDHNQRLWGLWTRLDYDTLPDGKLSFQTRHIYTYAELGLCLNGRRLKPGGTMLTDGRSVMKQQVSPSGITNQGDELMQWGADEVKTLTSNDWEELYLLGVGEGTKQLSEGWAVRQIVRGIDQWNDYVIVRPGTNNWSLVKSYGRFRHLYLLPVGAEQPLPQELTLLYEGKRWYVWVEISTDSQPRQIPGAWSASSALPVYFSAREY